MKLTFRTLTVVLLSAMSLARVANAAGSTATALQVSSPTVTVGTAVTLTAKVLAGSTPISPGQVLFCDATAAFCEGAAILGRAQLNAAGMASINKVFSIGQHTITAVFVGKQGSVSSVSASSEVTVTGLLPTATSFNTSGSAGNYTLNAVVDYYGILAAGTNDSVSFLDTSNANYSVATATLGNFTAPAYGFTTTAASPVAAGNLPMGTVVGDFNGDGIPDVATANFLDNTVSVLLGSVSGTFAPMMGSPFAVGHGPVALAVADINNDGILDILSVNQTDGNVSVLLGTGSGFTAGISATVGSGPIAVALGDFNADGDVDIAVANVLGSTISVLLGDGTGHFAAGPAVAAYTGENPNAIVAADFNKDGVADLVIANTTDGTVTILLNDGSANFTAQAGSPITVQPYPSALAVGDFNGDGIADIAVASATNNNVVILLNNAGSGFSSPSGSPFTVGKGPSSLAAADFNGDGKEDLFILNSDDSSATVLLGDGFGSFTASTQSPLANFDTPFSVALSDVNFDGQQDAVISNLGANEVSVRPLVVAQTATASAAAVSIPGSGAAHLLEASFGGDTNYGASTSTTASVITSKITTSTSLATSPVTTAQYMQNVQLTANVSPYQSANYTADGNVTFADGATPLNTGAAITNGQAAITVNSLAVGPHSLMASYGGDTNFSGSSTPSPVALTITRASTTTVVSAPFAQSPVGISVTFTATVTPATSGTPTGSVVFYDGGTSIATKALTGNTATFATSTLAVGAHNITAQYVNGDTNYAPSPVSVAFVETISGDFTVTATPGYQTVLPSQTTTYQVTVTGIKSGFFDPVALTVSGMPAGMTATLSPSTVTPNASSVASVLTVTAPAQTASLETHTSPAVWALLLFPLWFVRRRISPGAFALVAGLALLAGLTGCGRGGAGKGVFTEQPKSYTLTITGTSGTTVHSTAVTINVQ